MSQSEQKFPKPPRLGIRFLHWFCNERLVEEIEGDLEEYYLIYVRKYPVWRAKIYFWFHLFSFLRPYAFRKNKRNSKHGIMLKNYFKFSIRYLSKHRTNALLNVTSLSVGIACFLFIFIYLDGELSYDSYHKDVDRIHRVAIDLVSNNGDRVPDATTPPALSPALKAEFPEVAFATRIFPTWGSKYLMGANQETQFYEEKIYRVDPDFLDIFSYVVVLGDKGTMLSERSNIVLTERIAKKYFGDENPIGKEITIFNRDNRKKVVSGVLADVPFNSHFTFDFLTPLHVENRNIDEHWGWYNFYTYVKLSEEASHATFEEKLQPLYLRNNPRDTISPNITYSQPVRDIHLTSALKWELGANGNMNNITIFVSIGAFILLISLMNYLNLTVGGLVKRAKEVGVRKTFGAARKNLIGQFVTEALITISVSLLIGGILAEFAFTQLTDLFGREISLLESDNLNTFLILSVSAILFGLLAGLYPALHFASMGEIKGMLNKRKPRSFDLKKMLLIIQFTISIIMMVGTMVVFEQLNFFKNSNMGFNMDQVLIIENARQIGNQETFSTQIENLSFVEKAGYSDGVIGGINWTFSIGHPDQFLMNYTAVTPDYMDVMEFEFIEGRNFDKSIETDAGGLNFIVNEAGLRALKMELDQVGQSIPMASNQDSLIYGRVLGVVKDFHFSNFREEIKPYAFFFRNNQADNLTLRMSSSNIKANIEELESVWEEVVPGVPFESYFLDQSFESLHTKEERLSSVMLYLTILSIFISFIGMMAIANIVIKSRLKEVAVRKALGATTREVVNLFTRNFIIQVLIANAIGLPAAYFMMQEWLADFSYRMSLGPALFVFSLLITIGLAYIIVGSRSFRAANSDLTERLRDE